MLPTLVCRGDKILLVLVGIVLVCSQGLVHRGNRPDELCEAIHGPKPELNCKCRVFNKAVIFLQGQCFFWVCDHVMTESLLSCLPMG
ncbi:hypothetical protein GE061_015588 [Apolygus lucorum]|uniref:Secreted protein n=1 Tax=Apolygus lucorum TaxID=248454 RepID=A0A8S9XP75_APOLU|nr:hypothetical protein GE061_015588 [Apolygus lucorum]